MGTIHVGIRGDGEWLMRLDDDALDIERLTHLPSGKYPVFLTLPPPSGEPTEAEGVERIARERRRQVAQEGWVPEHDDGHTDGILAIAAAELAVDGTDAHVENPLTEDLCGSVAKFGYAGTKPDRVRALTIAGALIDAEIDRLLRTPTESREEKNDG